LEARRGVIRGPREITSNWVARGWVRVGRDPGYSNRRSLYPSPLARDPSRISASRTGPHGSRHDGIMCVRSILLKVTSRPRHVNCYRTGIGAPFANATAVSSLRAEQPGGMLVRRPVGGDARTMTLAMSVAAIRFPEIPMRAEADLEPCACHEHPALSLLLATYSGKGPLRVGGRTRQPGIQLIDETHGPGTVCKEPGVFANLLSTRQHGLARSPQDPWYVN
jgi:hypothetical protein